MKKTKYFTFIMQKRDRKNIKEEWIKSVIFNPDFEEIQPDGRIRRWSKIDEANGKYLRVILLEDGETVHNAFFDRSFKEIDHES